MAEQFLGEIRMMSFNFPPKGWAFCNGQTMAINQNQALFSLLGTTYGGDGQRTYGLPNLQGNLALHRGQGPGQTFNLGQSGGEPSHTLTTQEVPPHTHVAKAVSDAAAEPSPIAPNPGFLAAVDNQQFGSAYAASTASLVSMAPQAMSTAGGSQPHENRQPFLNISFCIALTGIFPSRT